MCVYINIRNKNIRWFGKNKVCVILMKCKLVWPHEKQHRPSIIKLKWKCQSKNFLEVF